MLFQVPPSGGELKKMQLSSHPRCALFEQQFVSGPEDDEGAPESVLVRYHGADSSKLGDPEPDGDDEALVVPLEPDFSALEKIDIVLHGSPTWVYRMGGKYDAWFSRRFGFPTILVYHGDGRRAVQGRAMLPRPAAPEQQRGGLLSRLASYVMGDPASDDGSTPWLGLADMAPFLVTSEASLRDVNSRFLNDGAVVEMYKFRPNIVVDGEGEGPWAEDFWAELAITTGGVDQTNAGAPRRHALLLTGNCARCRSLNVDYQAGKEAEGELGNVLKRLMKERRVDRGTRWSPIFGRYGFLPGNHAETCFTVSVGDGVEVTRRNAERSVWDWPGF